MKAPDADLGQVAALLASVLGEEQCVLVGALAVAAHGYVRASDDVDLLTRLDLREAQRLLREHGIPTVLKRGDPMEGDFPCLKGTLRGVEFDILPELVPIAWDNASRLSLADSAVLRVVDLDGLVRLKFRAGGPQDLMDAAHLLLQHPALLSKAREAATAYGVREKLEVWLHDGRIRSKVEGELRKQGAEGRAALKRLAKLLPRPRGRQR